MTWVWISVISVSVNVGHRSLRKEVVAYREECRPTCTQTANCHSPKTAGVLRPAKISCGTDLKVVQLGSYCLWLLSLYSHQWSDRLSISGIVFSHYCHPIITMASLFTVLNCTLSQTFSYYTVCHAWRWKAAWNFTALIANKVLILLSKCTLSSTMKTVLINRSLNINLTNTWLWPSDKLIRVLMQWK